MTESENVSTHFVPLPLPQEEQARADLYALVACLLLAPPDNALLHDLACALPLGQEEGAGQDQPLNLAWEALSAAAETALGSGVVHDEYDALFVGVGTPQINPYASLYIAGFMMEKPLMILRDDLAGLGLARAAGTGELEDHLGALCETMRLIITGEAGRGRQPLDRQKAFFKRHIVSWYERCLNDIRKSKDACFYRALADFIEAFFSIEQQAFDIESRGDGTETTRRQALYERL